MLGVAQGRHDDVTHHDHGDELGQGGERAEMEVHRAPVQVEGRKLLAGVLGNRSNAREVLETAAHSPRRRPLVVDPGEGRDSFRLVGEAATLLTPHAVCTVQVDDGRQVEVYPQRPAGGPGGLAEGADRASPGCAGLARRWQRTPQSGEAVDRASLEVDGDKRGGLELLSRRDETPDLVRAFDVAVQ